MKLLTSIALLLLLSIPSAFAQTTYHALRYMPGQESQTFTTLEAAERWIREEPAIPIGNRYLEKVSETQFGLGDVSIEYEVKPRPVESLLGSRYRISGTYGWYHPDYSCGHNYPLPPFPAYGCPDEETAAEGFLLSWPFLGDFAGHFIGQYGPTPPISWYAHGVNPTTGRGYVTVNANQLPSGQARALAIEVFEPPAGVDRTDYYECPMGFSGSPSHPDLPPWPTVCTMNIYATIRKVSKQHESCEKDGNPCVAATGNKEYRESDFDWEGISFTRAYNSIRDISPRSGLGDNWAHSFSDRLIPESYASVDVYWVRSDGYFEVFSPEGVGKFRSRNVAGRVLYEVAQSPVRHWKLVEGKGDVVRWFDAEERLSVLELGDRFFELFYCDAVSFTAGACLSENALTHVRSSSGRTLSFTYSNILVSLPSSTSETVLVPRISGVSSEYTLVNYRYDSMGRLSQAGMWEGLAIWERRYKYGEATNLCIDGDGVTIPACAPADFPYHLTGVIDESNTRYTNYTYDNYGRVTKSEYANGVGRVQVNYATISTTETRLANGALKTYQFDSSPFRKATGVILTSIDGSLGASLSRTYIDMRLTSSIDPSGHRSDYEYDDEHEVRRVEGLTTSGATTPVTRTIETDWHSTLGVVAERRTYSGTATLLKREAWDYNARGQPTLYTALDFDTGESRSQTTIYCEPSDVSSSICPIVGLVLSTDGARTDVADTMSYSYRMADARGCDADPATCLYRKGDLWKVTNALGQVTETLAYDGAGRVLSIKDANGVITDFEYHPRGWLTARKVRGSDDTVETDDRIIRIEYWPTALVKKVTQPGGSFTAYTYDAAHRLTGIADNAGNTIHYTLDNAGNRVQEDAKDAGGALKRTLSRIYNQLGQLSTRADADANPTDLTYDANGNLDTVTDAYGRITDNDYDPLNRLVRTLQDVGGIEAEIEFEYDALDRLTKVTDPKGLATTYTYNGFGDLTQMFSPDTRTTTYTYDSAGNRASSTDMRGFRAEYSYDALNRLTSIDHPYVIQDVSFVYDVVSPVCAAGETYAVGRLSRMTRNSDSTAYCYDRFGHVVRKVQTTNGQAFTVRYAYTKAGQLQSVVYPDGAVADYVRDAQGRVIEVGVTAIGDVRRILVNQIAWYPFGPAAGWVYGNGRSLERTYNLNYQPETMLDGNPGGLSLGYGFDAVGNLTQLNDGFQSTLLARYDYDALDRLSATRDGPTGTVIEAYGYDATGNRTSLTNAGGTTAYVYDADKHRLRKVGSATRWYDISGNTLSIGGSGREFAYNVAGRMKLAQRNNVTVMNYTYNGKGERVRKYLGTNNTYTVYDEAGRWLGDYDSSGAPLQQAIWLDSLPVGLLAGAGSSQQLHYVEPDHLGTPRVVIDPIRDVAVWAWDAKGEAFGNTIPDQDPDGDGTAFVFDMRFPGQRYDAASGLNYNYHRNYEAETGRYTRPDPIGLNGGVSMFLYANASPLKNVDPNGLMWFGPTCDAAQRAFITSQVIQLANEISSKASKGKGQCEEGNCDFELAADVMRWIAHKAYFSCDRGGPCAEVVGPYVYLYPPYIGAPDSSQISSPGTCGCFRSALFHEAAHAVRLSESEDNIRRETHSCVPCGTNVSESGGPL